MQVHVQPQTEMQPHAGNGQVYPAGYASPQGQTRRVDVTDSVDPTRLAITYTATLSDSAKFLGCSIGNLCNPASMLATLTGAPWCNIFCWNSKLRQRAYVSVHENRIESNYPQMACCGLCVKDNVSVEYFDKLSDSVKAETCCTPYHCCCCIELCGGVVALAPFDCLNCCFCPCCRSYYPGLQDSNAFAAAITAARKDLAAGTRSAPGASWKGPRSEPPMN